MAAGLRMQVQVMDYFFFHILFKRVGLRVLGLMAYWYTGSAFHQIPQSCFIFISAKIARK